MGSTEEESTTGRLVIVSNRLPVNLKKEADGSWSSTMSSGGLVAALSGLKMKSFLWIGWVGCEIAEEDQKDVEKLLLEVRSNITSCIPFYLDLFTEKQLHSHIFTRKNC